MLIFERLPNLKLQKKQQLILKLCTRTTFSVNHMLKHRLREKSYLFNDLIELGSDRPSEKKDSMSRQQTPKFSILFQCSIYQYLLSNRNKWAVLLNIFHFVAQCIARWLMQIKDGKFITIFTNTRSKMWLQKAF